MQVVLFKKVGLAMDTSSTFSVVYLGNLPSLDPEEGEVYNGIYYENADAENADALSGMKFDNFTQDNVQTWSPDSFASYDPALDQATYNQDNAYAGTDTFNITDSTGSTTTHGFDCVVVYKATVTYADGSQSTGEIVVVQDTGGDTWVVPPSAYTADAEMLDGDIQSIDIIEPTGTAASGLYYERAVINNIGTVPCFCAGTLIDTPSGSRSIETLRAGDFVLTRDRGAQQIRWIGARSVSKEDLAKTPSLNPILIEKGALSTNVPARDLMVSPQHRMLLRSRVVERMFDESEVLVAAAALTDVAGISRISMNDTVRYYHILLDNHEVILANGAETESLFPGPVALRAVGPQNFLEIVVSCPQVLEPHGYAVPARHIVKGRRARKLAKRHQMNGRLLVEAKGAEALGPQYSAEIRPARCLERSVVRPRVPRLLCREFGSQQSDPRVVPEKSEPLRTVRCAP